MVRLVNVAPFLRWVTPGINSTSLLVSILEQDHIAFVSSKGDAMDEPTHILLVRFKSQLSLDEVMRVVEERAPDFKALSGLQQKYYLQDAATGEYAGLYLWDSPEAITAYRESELRASIAKAYRADGEPRVEVYRVFKTLRDD